MCFFILYIIFPFFHPYVSSFLFLFFFFSFFFFYCFFSSTPVYPLLSLSSLLIFFFYLIPEHILQLSVFLRFLLLLDSEHSLALSVIRNKERDRERKNKREILLAPLLIEGHRPVENRRSLCQAVPCTIATCLPPQRNQDGSNGFCFFYYYFLLLLL